MQLGHEPGGGAAMTPESIPDLTVTAQQVGLVWRPAATPPTHVLALALAA
jgi:hypothetical protein